jgi:cyclophilin family peptidyl-prolyl cis-trans isomerase
MFSGLMLQAPLATAADPVVVEMETSKGKIVLELNAEKAPKTVDNFLKYVKDDFYSGTIFHRVIEDFMIQGGGRTADLTEKETLPPVRNEAGNGLENDRYTIAMARTGDPHSATSQFFINTADNDFLNRAQARDGYGYTVFGKVVEGKEVVDEIASVSTESRPDPAIPGNLMRDVPVEPVTIKSVKVVKPAAK